MTRTLAVRFRLLRVRANWLTLNWKVNPMDLFITTGSAFDATQVPETVLDLEIERIGKNELPRLAGLDRLTVTSLALRWLATPDLSAIPFPTMLEELLVWQSKSVTSIHGIQRVRHLRKLVWRENVPLEDASAVRELPNLRDLEFRSDISVMPGSSGLAFLSELTLDSLFLSGVKGRDVDLSPIARMDQPKELFVNGAKFPQKEIAKIAAVNSTFFDKIMTPKRVSKGLFDCPKCSGDVVHVQLKGIKSFLCGSCDQERITKALSKFNDLVESARALG